MSLDAFSYAYSEAGVEDAHEKLCLMAVADFCDHEGVAEISTARIADVACCPAEFVEGYLTSLEEQGYITVLGGTFGGVLFVQIDEMARRYDRAVKPPRKSSKPVPDKVRYLVYQRDGYVCAYCGTETDDASRSLDHVIPQSRGGEHTPENLVVCCRRCNSAKRDRTPEEMGWAL